MREFSGGTIEWLQNPDAADWDTELANLGGHPLQSALWGKARRAVDGINDQRWMALQGGKPIWMIRFEERRVPMLGGIAWAPRGPARQLLEQDHALLEPLRETLVKRGMMLVITDPWQRTADNTNVYREAGWRPRTIWIDVSAGRDHVWNGLHKRFKQSIRRSQRAGVTIESATLAEDVERFFALCTEISNFKGFKLPGSLPLMLWLLENGRSGSVESRLFIARRTGRLSAGVFLLRCGKSTHFFWGGTLRSD